MPSFALGASYETAILPWHDMLVPEQLQHLAGVIFNLPATAWDQARVMPVLDEFILDVGLMKHVELPGDDPRWLPVPEEGANVWARPLPGPSCTPAIIVLRTTPEERFVVTCNMIARHNVMTVQYFTMTGTRLGDPVLFNAKNPVLMRNLVASARSMALCSGALRSRHQKVHVLIHGNAKLIPDHCVVWSEHIRKKPSGKRLRCKTDLAHRNLSFKLAELVQSVQ